MAESDAQFYTVTDRTRIKRKHIRGHYDRETVHRILDAGLICHVGYVFEGKPWVLPTSYWREGDRVYWHGSSASAMLRRLEAGVPACFSVALLDGLVLSRRAFTHSMNYRSVVAYGMAEPVTDPERKLRVLESFTERVAPGRWAEMNPPTAQELKATAVMSMPLDEVAAKVRDAPPEQDPENLEKPIWTGVVPIHTVLGEPQPDAQTGPDMPVPESLKAVRIDC